MIRLPEAPLTREQVDAAVASLNTVGGIPWQESELVYTCESPGITAAEIARQRQAEDRAAAVQRIMAKRVDEEQA